MAFYLHSLWLNNQLGICRGSVYCFRMGLTEAVRRTANDAASANVFCVTKIETVDVRWP